MKQFVMPIHTKSGATVVTPSKFAISARQNRLRAELKQNKDRSFRVWGHK